MLLVVVVRAAAAATAPVAMEAGMGPCSIDSHRMARCRA